MVLCDQIETNIMTIPELGDGHERSESRGLKAPLGSEPALYHFSSVSVKERTWSAYGSGTFD